MAEDREMVWWVAGLLLALAALAIVAFLIQSRSVHFEKSAMGLQALATTLAIMFAGYWYVYERKGQPQADTALQVVGLKVSADDLLLESRFTIRNLGATLLDVGDTDARLKTINPDSLPLDKIIKLDRTAFPDTIGDQDIFDDGVLMWPTVRWFKGGGRRQIEPGESDVRVVDFIAACTNKAMGIYFAMQRPGSSQRWNDRALLSLTHLCSSPVGSKEMLNDTKSD